MREADPNMRSKAERRSFGEHRFNLTFFAISEGDSE